MNLIGEHVDYNDGLVLPMAIDRYVVIAGAPRDTDLSAGSVWSDQIEHSATISLSADADRHANTWVNYVQGVVSGWAARNKLVPAFDAWIESNVPLGGGLSSSAALEVATATMLEAITGITLPPRDKALLCQTAEHRYAGVPCGIMDQFSSVMCKQDHLMLLDCRSQKAVHVPFDSTDVVVLITNSNVRHELAAGQYAQRRQECEQAADILEVKSLRDCALPNLETARTSLGEKRFRRARHVVTEIERTREAAAAVGAGDWDSMGQLMYASHDSLRDDYEVSCAELDALVEIARSIGQGRGVVGTRMTGGGFGGCTVSLIRTDCVNDVATCMREEYRDHTGIEPSLYITRPSAGAMSL